MENESVIHWVQSLASDGQWEDRSGHHSLAEAKKARAWKEENTSNKYRIVRRVTTVLEDET